MKREYVIRPFQGSDEPAVINVWYRSGKATYSFAPTWQTLTPEGAAKFFRESIRARCDVWVGTLHGVIVGYIAMNNSYIDRLYVDPDECRRGLGARFVALARILSPDGLELHTHQENRVARAFYEKHGFRAVKFGTSPPPENVPDVEYHWRPVRRERLEQLTPTYDLIGKGYSAYRRPDPGIEKLIAQQLTGMESVVNVGAGTGSYEPKDRLVIGVEPAITMILQRGKDTAPVVQATASHLPFLADSFDAAIAILTVHHWPDKRAGLSELLRVAKQKVVILTWDPSSEGFWLIQRYFPEIVEIDRPECPTIDQFRELLGKISVTPVPIPHDCCDGFLGAYWRRPEAYLDAGVRAAISVFSKIEDVESRIDQLRDDLRSGAWDQEFGDLRKLTELDIGYRIIASEKR